MVRKKPTQAEGVADALMRSSRGSKVKLPLSRLPTNRQEARKMLRGNGPHMRFRYERDEDGERRAVRVL